MSFHTTNLVASNSPVERIKIKLEKITPPSSPSHLTSSNTDPFIAENLLNNVLGETKPSAGPIKSSNEILADLFKVFNATPPSIDDDRKTVKRKKKKHKKEKKLKKSKHKKHGQSSSDEDIDDISTSSENEQDDPLHKLHKSKSKKVKKEKKSEKRKSNADGDELNEKNRKRLKKSKEHEKYNDEQQREENKRKSNDKEKAPAKEEDSLKRREHQTSKEKEIVKIKIEKCDRKRNEDECTNHKDSNASKENTVTNNRKKIAIKSLVNSTVYRDTLKEIDREQKDKEKKHLKSKENRNESYHHLRSSSLSLSDEETYLKEREQYKFNRISPDSKRDHRRKRHRDRSREHTGSGFRSSYSSHRYERDRRRTRSTSRNRRENSEDRIDKKRLLEIARKNAISMLKNGTLPGTQNMAPDTKEKVLAKMRYGGKSVDELTDFCKKLSKGELSGYLSNVSDESDIDADIEKPFNHPFVLKDRGPIVMNIRNSVTIPPKTSEQTKAISMQFPVSSGQHHRLNESEWVPVMPPKPPKKDKDPQQQPLAITAAPALSNATTLSTTPSTTSIESSYQIQLPTTQPIQNQCEPPQYEKQPIEPTTDSTQNNSIFPDTHAGKDLDVTTIITKRLNAMRKLQDNPLDSEALKLMYNTQKDMSTWANSKFVPGQFTGSTGANILTAKELTSGFQAWAKKDQLISTTPVSGGMGMHLLQKMGWRPGEGLGKEKNGSLQPLLLEVKLDKRGLVADEENPNSPKSRSVAAKKKTMSIQMAKQNFESKHPVSLLGELCAKRKYGAPFYEIVSEAGPFHRRNFLFKVSFNGQIYQPTVPSLNKKEAKAVAARFALEQMGLLSAMPIQIPSTNP